MFEFSRQKKLVLSHISIFLSFTNGFCFAIGFCERGGAPVGGAHVLLVCGKLYCNFNIFHLFESKAVELN